MALVFDLYESDENADQRARAEAAVAVIRPDVEALGGRIEIVATEGGFVNVRLLGAGDHRSGSTESLRRLVEEALQAELPDLVRLDVSPPATQSRGPEPASGVFIPPCRA